MTVWEGDHKLAVMDKLKDVAEYKEEKTQKGAMKIEVVVEQAKKPKRDRPGSASSIRNIEDIEKRQKVTVDWINKLDLQTKLDFSLDFIANLNFGLSIPV